MASKNSHSVIANQVSFEARAGFPILKNISLSLSDKKIGLIGKNGMGKTTLLKLLAGELEPTQGKIYRSGHIAYLPQDYQFDLNQNIGFRKLATFSGGERMRLLLTKLLETPADFLFLDEPTNNLDAHAKELVQQTIKDWQGGCLVISHDRKVLNLMDEIWELTPKGLTIYGGNYSLYKSQKELEEQALESDLVTARISLKKAHGQAQRTKEKQEKRSTQGKKFRDTGSQPKIILNTMRNRSENTSSRLKKIHKKKLEDAERDFLKAKTNLPIGHTIYVDLSETSVPAGKLVVDIQGMTFSYNNHKQLFKDFDLTMYGPEHLVIKGPNGSGKSTLVKIILGDLSPTKGRIRLGVERTAYLDQHTSVLNSEETLVENIKRVANIEETEARKWLGRFLFSDETAFKRAHMLSGGERMRAALACVLAGEKPPQLLILDEPTNNLDLDSIERIESALSNFRGTLVVISHDREFLNNIGIEREIDLPQAGRFIKEV